jgi:hypothetical protein
MAEENCKSNACCQCDCDCECCKSGKCAPKEENPAHINEINWHLRATDTVGSSFLGILAILLLVFLVRSNKRNRELLLEVIQLRRQP